MTAPEFRVIGITRRGHGVSSHAADTTTYTLGPLTDDIKAVLDQDWDDPVERTRALVAVLDALSAVERYLDRPAEASEAPAASQSRWLNSQNVELLSPRPR